VDCYSCDQPAINACKRCSKPYCEDHGNATYCAECLQPSSALPSFKLYSGALLVLLIGSVVAILLLVRPPGESSGASPVIVGRSSPTATAEGGTPQATSTPVTPETTATASTPAADETPGATQTAGTATAATPSGTPSPFNTYVVEAGDTLIGIAEANLPPGDDLVAFAHAIATLNGLDYDNPNLAIGQELLLPKHQP
jgi:LysM repeat protein